LYELPCHWFLAWGVKKLCASNHQRGMHLDDQPVPREIIMQAEQLIGRIQGCDSSRLVGCVSECRCRPPRGQEVTVAHPVEFRTAHPLTCIASGWNNNSSESIRRGRKKVQKTAPSPNHQQCGRRAVPRLWFHVGAAKSKIWRPESPWGWHPRHQVAWARLASPAASSLLQMPCGTRWT
jgi:hypothetical protein